MIHDRQQATAQNKTFSLKKQQHSMMHITLLTAAATQSLKHYKSMIDKHVTAFIQVQYTICLHSSNKSQT